MNLSNSDLDRRLIRIMVVPIGHNNLFNEQFSNISCVKELPYYEISRSLINSLSSIKFLNNINNNSLLFEYCRYDGCTNLMNELDNFVSNKRILIILGLINYPDYILSNNKSLEEEFEYFERKFPYTICKRLCVFNYNFDSHLDSSMRVIRPLYNDPESLSIFPPQGEIEGETKWTIHYRESLSLIGNKIITFIDRQLEQCEEYRQKNSPGVNLSLITPWDDFEDLLNSSSTSTTGISSSASSSLSSMSMSMSMGQNFSSSLLSAVNGPLGSSSINSPNSSSSLSSSAKNRLKKKQYYSARIRKWMGDLCMQVGSPLDAIENYVAAISENRLVADNNLWLASALDGYAQAILLIRKLQDEKSSTGESNFSNDDLRKSFTSLSGSQLLDDVIGKDFKTLPPIAPLPDEVEGVGLPEKVILLAEERMNEALGIITDTISLLTASTLSSSSNLSISSPTLKTRNRLSSSNPSTMPLQNTVYNPITLLIILEAEMCFRMAKFILIASGNFYMKTHHVCDYIQRGISSIYNRKYLTVIPNGVVISFQNYIQTQQYHQTTQSMQQLMYIEQSIGLGIDLKIEILMYAVILLLNSEKYLGLQLKRKAIFYLLQVVRVSSDSNDFDFATQIMLRINDLIAEKPSTSDIDLNKFTDNNIYLTEDSTPNTWISIKKMLYTYGIFNSHGSENIEASTRFLSNLLNILTRIELEHFDVFDIMSKYNSKILGLDKFSMKKKSMQTAKQQAIKTASPLTEESLRLHTQPGAADRSKLSPTNASTYSGTTSTNLSLSAGSNLNTLHTISSPKISNSRSFSSSSQSFIHQNSMRTLSTSNSPPFSSNSNAFSVSNDTNSSKHHLTALMNPYSVKKKVKKSHRKIGNIKIREINEDNDFLGHHVNQIAQSISSLPISQKLSSLISNPTISENKSSIKKSLPSFTLGDKFLRNIFGDSYVDLDDEGSLLTFSPNLSTNSSYQMISLDSAKEILRDVASKLSPTIIPFEQLEAIFSILYQQCSSLINDPFSSNNNFLHSLENEVQIDPFTVQFSSNIISGGKRRSSDAIKYDSVISSSSANSQQDADRSVKFKQFLNSPSPFLLLPIIIFFIRPLILNTTYKLIPLETSLSFSISKPKSKNIFEYRNIIKYLQNLFGNSLQLIEKERKKVHNEDNEEEQEVQSILPLESGLKKNSSLFYDPFSSKKSSSVQEVTPLWSVNKISYFIMILSNPLNYSLFLSQVIPIVAYIDDELDSSTTTSSSNNISDNYLFGDQYVLTYPIDIEIPPRTEFFQISLGIKPLIKGKLKLLGLSYYIGNAYQKFLLDNDGNIIYNSNKSEEKFLFYKNNDRSEWKGVLGKMKQKIDAKYKNFTPSCTLVNIVDSACDISFSTSFNSSLLENSKPFDINSLCNSGGNSVTFNLDNNIKSAKKENSAVSAYHKSTRGSSVASYNNLNHQHAALTITSPPLYTNTIPYTNKSINSLNITNPFSNFHTTSFNDSFDYKYTLFSGESKKENISINILPLLNLNDKNHPRNQYFYDIRIRVTEHERVRPLRINKILEKEKEKLSASKDKEAEELKDNSYLLYDFNTFYEFFDQYNGSSSPPIETIEEKPEESFDTSIEILSIDGIKSLQSVLQNETVNDFSSLNCNSTIDISLFFHHKHHEIKSLKIEVEILFIPPAKISSLLNFYNCMNYMKTKDSDHHAYESQLQKYQEGISCLLEEIKASRSTNSYFYLKKIDLNFNLAYESLSIISNIQPYIHGFQDELIQLEEQLQEVLLDNPYTNSCHNNFYYQQYSLIKNYNKVFTDQLYHPSNKNLLNSFSSQTSHDTQTLNNNIISSTIDFYLKEPLPSNPSYATTFPSIKLKLLNNKMSLIFTFNNNFSTNLYISFNKKALLSFLEMNSDNNSNFLSYSENFNSLSNFYLTYEELYSYYLDSQSENPSYSPVLFTIPPSSCQKLTIVYSLNPKEMDSKLENIPFLNLSWATITFNITSTPVSDNYIIRNGSFILSEKFNSKLINSLTKRLMKVALTSSSTLLSSASIIHSSQKYSTYTNSLLNLLLNLTHSPQPIVSFHPRSLLIDSFLQANPMIFVNNIVKSASVDVPVVNNEHRVCINQLFSVQAMIQYYLPISVNSTKSIAHEILTEKISSNSRDVDIEFFYLIYNISHPNSISNSSNILYTPSISSSYLMDGKAHTIKKMKSQLEKVPYRTSSHQIKLRFLHSGRYLLRLFIKVKDPHPEATSTSSWFTSADPVVVFVSNN